MVATMAGKALVKESAYTLSRQPSVVRWRYVHGGVVIFLSCHVNLLPFDLSVWPGKPEAQYYTRSLALDRQ